MAKVPTVLKAIDGPLTMTACAPADHGCDQITVFAWEQTPRERDHVFEGPRGVRVFVDPRSFRLLDGTVLGYDTSLISRGFLFENPHAKGTCGCGISFSVVDTHPASPDEVAGEDHQ
jgi:iron-sulfur cluster assembly accessory protein